MQNYPRGLEVRVDNNVSIRYAFSKAFIKHFEHTANLRIEHELNLPTFESKF